MNEIGPLASKEKSISLSEEWAELSAAFCGPEYMKALGNFFESRRIQTVLECACGDGHVLSGVADKITEGIGVDSDEYLISQAQQQHQRPNIKFKKVDILDIDIEPDLSDRVFDAVMLRGNSITALGAWGTNKDTFDPATCEEYIRKALIIMWGKLKRNGVLYLDVTRQKDIDKGDHKVQVDLSGVHLIGEITIDFSKKRRDVFGRGTVNGKRFEGGSSSYLIGPSELRQRIEETVRPKNIWR